MPPVLTALRNRRVAATIVLALFLLAGLAPLTVGAADKPEKKTEKTEKTEKSEKSKDKDKPKQSAASTVLIDKDGLFTATKAMEKWLRFENTAATVRITWAATANTEEDNNHSASFLQLVLMYEVGRNANVKQKSWKVFSTIVDRAAPGDGQTGTVELPPNNYAIIASGSNIGYRVKVEQIVAPPSGK